MTLLKDPPRPAPPLAIIANEAPPFLEILFVAFVAFSVFSLGFFMGAAT
jgi:hypothetical protein